VRVVDFGKLLTKTNEQKFSLGGVQCKKICSHPERNSIYSIVKVIYAGGVEVSRKEGKNVSVVEVVVFVSFPLIFVLTV